MKEEYEIIGQCDCECHSNPNITHFAPCCYPKKVLKKQYYTPELEDLFIGYECEVEINGRKFGNPHKLMGLDLYLLSQNLSYSTTMEESVRTPYLTKEQIESEGWNFIGRSTDIWFEKKDPDGIILREDGHHLKRWLLHYGLHDKKLTVTADFISGSQENFFEGRCFSINELRKIVKLIGI